MFWSGDFIRDLVPELILILRPERGRRSWCFQKVRKEGEGGRAKHTKEAACKQQALAGPESLGTAQREEGERIL